MKKKLLMCTGVLSLVCGGIFFVAATRGQHNIGSEIELLPTVTFSPFLQRVLRMCWLRCQGESTSRSTRD